MESWTYTLANIDAAVLVTGYAEESAITSNKKATWEVSLHQARRKIGEYFRNEMIIWNLLSPLTSTY